jgi:hypothetical protein
MRIIQHGNYPLEASCVPLTASAAHRAVRPRCAIEHATRVASAASSPAATGAAARAWTSASSSAAQHTAMPSSECVARGHPAARRLSATRSVGSGFLVVVMPGVWPVSSAGSEGAASLGGADGKVASQRGGSGGARTADLFRGKQRAVRAGAVESPPERNAGGLAYQRESDVGHQRRKRWADVGHP